MIQGTIVVMLVMLIAAEVVLIIVGTFKTNRFLTNLKVRFPVEWVGLGKPEAILIRIGWSNDPTLFNFIRTKEYTKLRDHEMVEEGERIALIYRVQLGLFVLLGILAIGIIIF